MSEERSPYAATGAIQRMRERLAADTPGRRLHAALLAHGIEYDAWDSYHPLVQRDFERAAREYGADCGCRRGEYPADPGGTIHGPTALLIDDIRDRLDALAAEVAALRRDRDADLAAMGEVGDRLSILESSKENVGSWLLALDGWRRTQEALGPFASQSEIDDCETRLSRCEGRDGEIIDRLGKLEKGQPRPGQMADIRTVLMRHEDRIAALEARALDGGDPLRRGPMPFRNDDMPTPDGFYRVIVDEIRALPWTTGQDGMFRCVSDEVWRARITPLLRRLDHEMTDGEGSDLADVVLGIGGGDPPRRNS